MCSLRYRPRRPAGATARWLAQIRPSLGLLRQAGQDHEAVPGGHGAKALRERAGHGLGLFLHPRVSPVSGDVQLREADDRRTVCPGAGHPVLHAIEVRAGGASRRIEDDGGNTH